MTKADEKKILRIKKLLHDCKGWRTKHEMIFTLGNDEKLFDFALLNKWIREKDSPTFLAPRYYKNFRNDKYNFL